MNQATLLGRISSDINLKVTQNGHKIATFSFVTNNRYKDASGETKDQATFHNIVAFGAKAEAISRYLVKGRQLFLQGKIENRTYEKTDGSKGYISEIQLTHFEFIADGKSKKDTSSDPFEQVFGADAVEDLKLDDLPFNS